MEGYRYIDKCKDYKYCGFLCEDISKCFINTYNQDDGLTYIKKAQEYYTKGNLTVNNYIASLPLVTIYLNKKEWALADSVFRSFKGDNLHIRRPATIFHVLNGAILVGIIHNAAGVGVI